MSIINAEDITFSELNERIRLSGSNCRLTGCLGQRFIAAGSSGKNISIEGVPGNALGAYLSGSSITVFGNAQDAVGDTMNDGVITIHGNVGDAVGYAMRGGKILIKGNAGYRAGIHMKEYKEKKPVIVIGGCAGSFLGEYQAGGLILVLNAENAERPIVGNFPCTGMHGGKMILRGNAGGIKFPSGINKRAASPDDIAEVTPVIKEFCKSFGYDTEKMLADDYTVITPDSKNPYKQMYVAN